MYHSMVQGNEESDDPRWDDVLRFLPGQSRNNRSSTSIVSRAVTIYEDDESSPLLTGGIRPTRRQVAQWTNSIWKRQLVLLVLPVSIVLAWCAVPLKSYPDDNPDANLTSDSIPSFNPEISTPFGLFTRQATDPSPPVLINFWFFLWFYYGLYNAIALLLITKIFNIYSLNWWPKALGGLTSYIIFWLSTQLMGIIVYYFTGLESYRLTWVCLTFCTMTIPLLVAFLVIRSENRNVYRHSLTVAQKTFLSATVQSRIPASYIRFLWFCVALAIALSTIIAGELYADQFLDSLPHSGSDALIYVYSWVGTIYVLDAVTDYIVDTRVKSYPLSSIFKLYFFMIYFIFYRNLFARLRDYTQFVQIQIASSVWVCIFHPVCMSHTAYRVMVYLFGIQRTYEEYKRQIGRSLYLRNLAENATMVAFLCWVNILHFGPNAKVYPYFQFQEVGTEYSHTITVKASLGIWCSELVSNFINRAICRRYLGHHVTKEALKDFKEYPELIVVFVLVMVHILQDMLLALLHLNFA